MQTKNAVRGAAFVILVGFLAVASSPKVSAAGVGPQGAFADVMRKSPYLIYPGTPGQMQVLWQHSSTATSTLSWGTDPACSAGSTDNAEYGSDHQHAVTLTGLLPATTYYYRVTTLGVSYTGTFLSAPAVGTGQLKFLAYGDTRSYPDQHDAVAAAMLAKIASDSSFRTLALCSGDLVSDGEVETAWSDEWFAPAYASIRAFTGGVPLVACVGNHDVASNGTTLFTKYLPYAFAGSRYYSFDYGPAHFAVLDQYVKIDSSSTQGRWFTNDLASSTKPWKFVLLHEPGWSAGGHSNNTTVQQQIAPLCERYGVAVVFAGHNHYYARAVRNGVQHVTTGGGGASLHSPEPGQPNVVASAPVHHYCRVAIDGGTLRFEAVDAGTRTVIDSFTLRRDVTDTMAPTVTVTAPAGGEAWVAGSQHDVTWSASDNVGVNSVSLLCSRDGGATYPDTFATGIANTGTWAWTLPADTCDVARVKVMARDAAGNVGADASDSNFRIVRDETPVAVSVVFAEADAGRVRVRWYIADAPPTAAVYRRTETSGWTKLADVATDGSGYLTYEDSKVEAGGRYGYRLGVWATDREVAFGETWVSVPALGLALVGPAPNPSRAGSVVVECSLPGPGPATIELLDVAGRVVESRRLAASGTGLQVVTLGSGLRAGLYVVRLRQGLLRRQLKAVVAR